MPFLDLPDTRLAFDLDPAANPDTNTVADKPVLVLAHSLGVHRAMWTAALPILRQRWRILRYDLRGHGESALQDLSPGAQTLSIETLGQDVLRMTRQLGLQRFAFCGVSLGGLIGQWLGIHAPERLDHLFLANTAMKFGEAAAWNARIELVRQQGLSPVIEGTMERWFTADFRAREPEKISAIRQMLASCPPAGYLAGCAAVRDADFRATAARIQAHTLVIAGSFDPVSTPTDGQALAAQIPGAQSVELPAAHLCAVECPDIFASAMLSFACAV